VISVARSRSISGLAPDIRLGQTEVIVLRDLEVETLNYSSSTTDTFDTPGSSLLFHSVCSILLFHHVTCSTQLGAALSPLTAPTIAPHPSTTLLRIRTVSFDIRRTRAKRWQVPASFVSSSHSGNEAWRLNNSLHCWKWGQVGCGRDWKGKRH
jgi:hypothetical protein